MKITSMSPTTGRMVLENGNIYNIADALSNMTSSGAVTDETVPIYAMSPRTGRMVREDGSIVNIADILKEFIESGSGGNVTPEQIQAAVDSYLGKNPVQINQATESMLGGIKAKQKTNETVEAAIDPATGKLYVPTYPSGGGSADTDKINHGTSDTTFALTPNIEHVWGEVPSLTITFAEEEEGKSNVYWFSFDSGSTPTVLSLPADVESDLTVKTNTHYEISINDKKYMLWSEWGVQNE